MTEQDYLKQSIDMALLSLKRGGGPFGAVIVKDGQIITRAHNQVRPYCDPSAHAEVHAIRRAAKVLGAPHLTGCVLYTSCEPCPMCLATALWAHIDRIVYAAGHQHAQEAGFDDTAIATQLYGQPQPHALPSGYLRQGEVDDPGAPFRAWLEIEDRDHY